MAGPIFDSHAHYLSRQFDGDRQALLASEAPVKLPIGINTTQGLGAGADPERGEKAALESREEIDELLKNVNMLFITAGMGGGTK